MSHFWGAVHAVYRETRAQELTEHLWAHPESPWHQRINMLGESGLQGSMVTQAAWIRSLMATYVKSYEGPGVRVGGLFGAPAGRHDEVLSWSRTQQAAFLIFVGKQVVATIAKSKAQWAESLRRPTVPRLFASGDDPAVFGPHSLLNTDQGIRGLLFVTNDLCFVRAEDLDLDKWAPGDESAEPSEKSIASRLGELRHHKVAAFAESLALRLATFDWRSSSAPGLSEPERLARAALRGSGGYKELRRRLLFHLAGDARDVGEAARSAIDLLQYK